MVGKCVNNLCSVHPHQYAVRLNTLVEGDITLLRSVLQYVPNSHNTLSVAGMPPATTSRSYC